MGNERHDPTLAAGFCPCRMNPVQKITGRERLKTAARHGGWVPGKFPSLLQVVTPFTHGRIDISHPDAKSRNEVQQQVATFRSRAATLFNEMMRYAFIDPNFSFRDPSQRRSPSADYPEPASLAQKT